MFVGIFWRFNFSSCFFFLRINRLRYRLSEWFCCLYLWRLLFKWTALLSKLEHLESWYFHWSNGKKPSTMPQNLPYRHKMLSMYLNKFQTSGNCVFFCSISDGIGDCYPLDTLLRENVALFLCAAWFGIKIFNYCSKLIIQQCYKRIKRSNNQNNEHTQIHTKKRTDIKFIQCHSCIWIVKAVVNGCQNSFHLIYLPVGLRFIWCTFYYSAKLILHLWKEFSLLPLSLSATGEKKRSENKRIPLQYTHTLRWNPEA